ncbi:hypothetical protein FHP88_15720 [Sedimenticola selenatireducens]|uniref:Uncharacterized protein n=1 Tax=Sedimenticola selenatireducens TaxID=191960 RepID=A0A557S0E2_9GAMM|nr:hypothetical protein [Sedimenticola selenatireducens]TVO70901.1 hypothetical protein FHP88_15720 [Sedimenticola selenatireducens]
MKTEKQLAHILDEVISIAMERGKTAATAGDDFSQGEASAYHDMLEHVVQAAEQVGYDMSELGLDGHRVDELLLPIKKKAS